MARSVSFQRVPGHRRQLTQSIQQGIDPSLPQQCDQLLGQEGCVTGICRMRRTRHFVQVLGGMVIVEDARVATEVLFPQRVDPVASVVDADHRDGFSDATLLRLQASQLAERFGILHRCQAGGQKFLRRSIDPISFEATGDRQDLVLFPAAAGFGVFLASLHTPAVPADDQQLVFVLGTAGQTSLVE